MATCVPASVPRGRARRDDPWRPKYATEREADAGGCDDPVTAVADERIDESDGTDAELVLTALRALSHTHPELLSGRLAALEQLDAVRREEYQRTLLAFFDAAGDVATAAAVLYVHPNTVRYRLRRLREITGLDLADPLQRFVAELQLRVTRAED